jgi:hypothetical protein
MTFFYDLNKKLNTIRELPETTHKQLNERANSKAVKEGGLGAAVGGGLGALAAGPIGAATGAAVGHYGEKGLEAEKTQEGMSRAAKGYEKYGKEGMEALAKAGRDDASANTMDAIRNRYNKYDNEEVDEGMGMTDEGNAFSDQLRKTPKGGKFKVGGKEYTDTSNLEEVGMTPKQKSFAALAPPKDKITFADKIAGAKKEVDEMLGDVAAEAMKKALGGGSGRNAEMDEASDDNAFTAHKRARAETPKVGTITHGSKHDVEEIPGGRRVTRRTDAQGISVGSETDDEGNKKEKRTKAGRPDGSGKKIGAKGPSGKSKLMTREGDVDITDQGEYDQEGDMAKDSIKTIVRHAQALSKVLGDNDNLPEWVQSKLAKIESMMTAVDDYMQNQETDQDDEMAMGEEKTSTRDNRAERAGKRVAKDIEYDEKKKDGIHGSRRGSEDNKAEKAGKRVTKDIEHDEKEDDEKEDKPKKSKSKFKFGGSVYENLDAQLETLINESMNVTVNMATSDDGQGDNTITVTASGEDAMTLAQLLKSAGLAQSSHGGCSTCGQSSCGCEQVDENSPDYPTNTETSNNAFQYSGGLNKPKSTGQTTTPVLASQLRRQVSMEESVKIERNLFDLYKNFAK